MKIRLEWLNSITGALLIISGLLNLFRGQLDIAAGWIIFGSMYLVMDNYSPNPSTTSLPDKIRNKSRIVFGWVGLIVSFLLFLYYLYITFRIGNHFAIS